MRLKGFHTSFSSANTVKKSDITQLVQSYHEMDATPKTCKQYGLTPRRLFKDSQIYTPYSQTEAFSMVQTHWDPFLDSWYSGKSALTKTIAHTDVNSNDSKQRLKRDDWSDALLTRKCNSALLCSTAENRRNWAPSRASFYIVYDRMPLPKMSTVLFHVNKI